ncbi:protein TPRXL [Nocardioides albertanoniae]|uniref:protein TPRXL n=1 Tax=Nocardioides albertanoniae TaxID=1175486 RepID=UPI00114FB41E|nr:protein TPRXL [Nocardioides albertanoniae]
MNSASESTSLREMLGASKDPEFEIKLLPGWERRTPDDDDRERLNSDLKARLSDLRRPDLYGTVSKMVDESYDSLNQQSAIAYYAPMNVDDDATLIPGSLVASIRRSPADGTLDDLIASLIRDHGARPLFGDKRFVRFERESTVKMEESTVYQNTIIYLTPIPGSKHRRALQFTASFIRPLESSSEDKLVRSWKFAFDACVSTLRWLPAGS